ADETDFLVALTLSEYFGGINHHDYLQSYNVLAPPLQAVQQGYDNFASGYATTNDSSIVVGNVYDASDGEVEVGLSFTSNQAPMPANYEEQCTVWSMHYGLVQNPSRGSPFLIASAENVGPAYQSC
ncbi:MAG TPA: hypothetical protein VEJ87_05085, partial [Acidimicrobiales bacterium]|nr:hypothetical protein [Acidimicrobiales bacterium]